MVTVPRGEAPVQGRLRSGVGAVVLHGEAECAMSALGAQGRRRCGGSVRKVPHSDSVLLFMGVWEVVGSGFTAPITLLTVAVNLATVAHDVPHDAVPFETEQLIPRYPEDRAEWGGCCSNSRLR